MLASAALGFTAGTVAAASCATTTTSTYSIQVCISAPAAGATLTGDTTTAATAQVLSGSAAVQRMVFNVDGAYVLTDYQSPYTFTLPTARWVDGAHTISVSALLRDGTTTSATTETVSFSNGTTTAWGGNTVPFAPAAGTGGSSFVAAAVGDGAGGDAMTSNVLSQVKSWNPNLLLYLGDVYEKGSGTEFYNWYAQGYGQLRSITDPVIGNHEYSSLTGGNGQGYFGYWGPNSDTYSFDTGGWHFIALNANSQLSATQWQNQLNWLNNDLAAHAGACIVASWHEPLFNVGPEGSTTRAQDFWTPLANAHATLVLNGHDHTYQRWTAMDATGTANAAGVTELIAGGGGHSAQTIATTDPRVLASVSGTAAYGALKLSFTSTAVGIQYVSASGSIVDTSSVSCKGSSVNATGSISGRVTNSSGGAIAGATVSTTGASTTTNKGGNYTLSNLPVGTYQVTASAPGFGSKTQTATVTAGGTTSLPFTLSAPGSISGTVADSVSGTAIAGATVTTQGATATTDSSGSYTLSGLAAGSYQVTASASGYGSQTLAATVTAGATSSLSFALAASPGSIAGTVTDASTGQPIAGASVATTGASTTTNGSGAYTLSGLAAGSYQVTASASGYNAQVQTVGVTAGSSTTQSFALSPIPGSIAGTVTDASSGLPIAGATVSTTGASATTDGTGSYTLSGLTQGSYSVTASAAGYVSQTASASVVAGGTTNLSFSLSVPSPTLFSDGFESGNLSAWTTSPGMSVQSAFVNSGSFAGEASTATGGVYARKTLSATQTNLYLRAYVYVRTAPAAGQNATLIGVRNASGGSIARIYLNSSGTLGLRNDVAATSTSSTTTLSSGAWHSLELHVVVNGTSSTTEAWLDGVSIAAFSNGAANLGTTAVGGIQIGENQTSRSYDFVFDDVVASTSFI